ncbi:MAG: pentapeptide repeat-containing protein [Ketobacter sp.]|nr:pentapeptide repeat-containing protein [Planctomycetota bacterium]MCP5015845.1 pentapeptide repeat-containing protein [Ketobacter sp.]
MASQEDDQQRIQLLETEVAQLRRELLEQEHRPALAAWKWLRAKSSHAHAHEGAPSGRALFWSVLNFFLSFRVVVIGGGVFIGYVTLLLMYQSNLISAKQNYYMQQQIYIQAQSERRRLLAEIKEKLYEPSAASAASVAEYGRCMKSKKASSCAAAELEPAFNHQTRSEFLKTYVDLQRTPLKQPVFPKIPTLLELLGELWDSLTGLAQAAEGLEPSELTPACSAGSQLDLSNAFLQEVKLVGGCLRNVNFAGANLTRANFVGSDLRDSDFTQARMSGSKMTQGDFRGAVFDRAVMDRASFVAADLQNVGMKRVVADRADFSKANLAGINAEDGSFLHADFRDTDMVESNLMFADAYSANFAHADLTNANFSWVDLRSTIFGSADFKGTIIVGALFGDLNKWVHNDGDFRKLPANSDWEKARASEKYNEISKTISDSGWPFNVAGPLWFTCMQLHDAVGGEKAFVNLNQKCEE